MNFDYDPSRHPPVVGRVISETRRLVNAGQFSKQEVVPAMVEAMKAVARSDGQTYQSVADVVFGAMEADAAQFHDRKPN